MDRVPPQKVPGSPFVEFESNFPGRTATPGRDIEELPLREILSMLLGREGKRMLALRNKTNEELFNQWRGELRFKYNSDKALEESCRVITKFEQFLGGFPPSCELAKTYLSQSGR